MTPTTLQALRRLLFFSRPEAAELVGGVTERSWNFWESGDRPIPADVIERINDLVLWRESAIHAATHQILDADIPANTDVYLVWYDKLDDWMSLPGRKPELWRPQCSVVAQICADIDAIAVPFDAHDYQNWLDKRADSESMRAQWATLLR